jgi:molybdopterin-guanine dinucleotide biosynthesis protein A
VSRAPAIVAVLAGGTGSRLGESKPLAQLGAVPMIEYPLRAARDAGLPVIVVAKSTTRLPAIEAGLVLEPDEPAHPLLGIVAALRYAAGADVLTLPCDMPFVPASLIAFLASLAGCVTVEAGGRPQPLLSRLAAPSRPALERALATDASAREAVASLAPRVVEEGELARFGDPELLFSNVNTPEDLRRARARLTGRESARVGRRSDLGGPE